jgi:hypothetical protein
MNPNPIEITKDAVGGALRVGQWAAGQAVGTLNRVRGGGPTAGPPKDFDDVTIARKVETVVFRPAGRAKGKIDVNVVDGVVWLRGEARRPEEIAAIEADARAIPEVVDVQNLLHLPKTPARSRTAQPTRARKPRATATTAATAAQPRAARRRVNADKTIAAEGEPLPKDLASEKKGRQPAPLGAEGGGEPAAASAEPATTPEPAPAAEPARTPEPAPTTDRPASGEPAPGGFTATNAAGSKAGEK